MKKFKSFIRIALVIGGMIGIIACIVAAWVFMFHNPDMTDMRRLIEYPAPTIWSIVCLVAVLVGKHMI